MIILISKSHIRSSILSLITLITFTTLVACKTNEPKVIRGLTVELLNYSQETVLSMKLNGNVIGSSARKAKIGAVEGGGSSCCSGEISAISNSAPVTIETVRFLNGKNGEVVNEIYTTQALVEFPLPPQDMRGALIIHVLPGRKVVIEVASFSTFGRRDLLEAQIKALGLIQEVPFSDLLRTGPNKYID